MKITKNEKKEVFGTDLREGEYEPNAEEIAKYEPEKLPRKIVPYTEPLPEMSDREINNSTLLGIDTSEPGTPGYGVRDDVEIAIAKEFGDNSNATKFMMASVVYQQKMLEMYQAGVDFEVYDYMSVVSGTLTNCSFYSLSNENTKSRDKRMYFVDLFFAKKDIIKKLQFNTP